MNHHTFHVGFVILISSAELLQFQFKFTRTIRILPWVHWNWKEQHTTLCLCILSVWLAESEVVFVFTLQLVVFQDFCWKRFCTFFFFLAHLRHAKELCGLKSTLGFGLFVNLSHCLLAGLLDYQNGAREFVHVSSTLSPFELMSFVLHWKYWLVIQNKRTVAGRGEKLEKPERIFQIQGFPPLSLSVSDLVFGSCCQYSS